MDETILLTNIQRFSLQDGPGIRTTVFLKGCSLRCPWCSNPENLKAEIQEYCKDGVKGTYGRWVTVGELVHECLKDKAFYEGKISSPDLWRITDAADIEKLPGGVTLSGGEALLQADALVPVIEALHEAEVHVAVETALFVPPSYVEIALDLVDFFYVDMKILDESRCREIEKGSINLYLENLDRVMKDRVPVVIRVPVIGGQTDDDRNRTSIKELLTKYQDYILKVELIKEHNLGESKYKSLGMNVSYNGVSDELMERYKEEIIDIGIPVELCKI